MLWQRIRVQAALKSFQAKKTATEFVRAIIESFRLMIATNSLSLEKSAIGRKCIAEGLAKRGLVPERRHWIVQCGAAGGDVGREEGNETEEGGDSD